MDFLNFVPFYFLIISFVVCSALVWIFYRAKKLGLEIRRVMDISIVVLVSGFLGARVFHVFYEYPEVYLQNPSMFFDFGRGGYIYYGGVIVGILCGSIFVLAKKDKNFWTYFDFFAPVASLGYALGRTACLYAGCCYGTLTNGEWGMKVSDQYGTLHLRHPTPLYSTILELIIFSFVFWLDQKPDVRKKLNLSAPASVFFVWLLLHSTGRFFLEFLRDDFRGPQFIFSISGWISLIFVGISIFFLLSKNKSRTTKS